MYIKAIKKFITSAFLLYAFNMILVNFGVVIPINLWTIIFVGLFDVSGVIILLIFKSIGV